MSSMGSQWKAVRHFLSISNFTQEVEKLVQRLKPATPDQWETLIKKFENGAKAKLAQSQQVAAATLHSVGITNEGNKSEELVKKVAEPQTKVPPSQGQSQGDKLSETINPDSLSINSDLKEITIESLLSGLRLKKDLHLGKISDDKSWKTNKPAFSKTTVHSRTAFVISALVAAETKEAILRRTEQFIDHIKQFPETRDYAIKEGGVRTLLRAKYYNADSSPLSDEISGAVKEALALLGHTGPCKRPGPNILSIDGGGIRGIIAIEILKHLEKLTGQKVTDMFDYIVGVSTGAILAAVVGSGIGNLETASNMYFDLSKKTFGTTSRIGGTSRLMWSHSYYDTEAWEKLLKDNLGEMTLTQCNRKETPHIALVSCVVNPVSHLTAFLFRTYEMPFRIRSVFPGTTRAQVWEAVRASAAAPTYFQEFKHNGLLHQDGGIMVNNPAGVGLHEARLLFGPQAVQNGCLISVGTGKALNKHPDYQYWTKGIISDKDTANSTSWKDKFNRILDSATDTEGVHLVLNDLLPQGAYFRLNPPLMEQCAMDEIDPDKLKQLQVDTQSYIRRNRQKFQEAADMLVRTRSVRQKIEDYIQVRAQLIGKSYV